MQTILTQEETEIINLVLRQIVIESRTGIFGINHSANRFVSTNIPLKKEHTITLDKLAIKVGINNGIKRI